MPKHSNYGHNTPENDGVHLHSLLERTGCDKHKALPGQPCFVLPNNVDPQTDYVAACGSRIKKIFTGRVSAQSMRSEAPRKSGGPGAKRSFKKKHSTSAPSRG